MRNAYPDKLPAPEVGEPNAKVQPHAAQTQLTVAREMAPHVGCNATLGARMPQQHQSFLVTCRGANPKGERNTSAVCLAEDMQGDRIVSLFDTIP
jgi:hypothetical protein